MRTPSCTTERQTSLRSETDEGVEGVKLIIELGTPGPMSSTLSANL